MVGIKASSNQLQEVAAGHRLSSSNWLIDEGKSYLKVGCSGYTRAMRHAIGRPIEKMSISSGYLGKMIQSEPFSRCSRHGCVILKRADGLC